MERRYYIAQLFDYYGVLLSKKQQECLRLHLIEDFSLAEIGEELGITRQAAHDNIRRAERALDEMEHRLGLVARHSVQDHVIGSICAELCALEEPITRDAVQRIADTLRKYTTMTMDMEKKEVT